MFSSKCPTGLLQKPVVSPISAAPTGVCHVAPGSPGSPQPSALSTLQGSTMVIATGLITLSRGWGCSGGIRGPDNNPARPGLIITRPESIRYRDREVPREAYRHLLFMSNVSLFMAPLNPQLTLHESAIFHTVTTSQVSVAHPEVDLGDHHLSLAR